MNWTTLKLNTSVDQKRYLKGKPLYIQFVNNIYKMNSTKNNNKIIEKNGHKNLNRHFTKECI